MRGVALMFAVYISIEISERFRITQYPVLYTIEDMVFFSGKIRFDAASHIVVHRLVFEAILFLYLVTALWMQNLNIYKKVYSNKINYYIYFKNIFNFLEPSLN